MSTAEEYDHFVPGWNISGISAVRLIMSASPLAPSTPFSR
jgi:hypothetical protein